MRFYCSQIPETQDFLLLSKEEAHHARRVLRLEHGQSVIVLDGKGHEATGILEFPDPGTALVRILSRRNVDCISQHRILGIAVPENRDTLALIVRSAVELEVTQIVFLITRFSGVRMSGNVEKYMDRWTKSMIAACKQSGRLWFPAIRGPANLDPFLRSLPQNLAVCVGWEPALEGIPEDVSEIPMAVNGFVWIVGPEGGWSKDDRSVLAGFKVHCIRLGHLTLTSHVATIAGISALRTMFRDWSSNPEKKSNI